MGSVIDHIECPNCGQEAYSDFYYKTGEEYVNCNSCGYHYSAIIKNRDKKLNELTDEDWEIKELKTPYAAFKIKYYDSFATQCGSIATVEEFEQFVSEITSFANQENSIENVLVSKLVSGSIEVDTILDNGPKIDSAGFTKENR